jgi:hypothetical protein
LLACHRETISYKEGRIITSHFQITDKQSATFVATYGIPHSGNDRRYSRLEATEENEILQEMRGIQEITNQSLRMLIKVKILSLFMEICKMHQTIPRTSTMVNAEYLNTL